MHNKPRKLLVTGGHGMLGCAFKEFLPESDLVVYPKRSELDLDNREFTMKYFLENKFTHVYHLAARVGGVKDNFENPADLFTENMRMNMNIIDSATKSNVEKVLSILSTCIYPEEKYISYPATEEQLHLGPPHEGTFGYAFAKRMLDVLCKVYNTQYSTNYINVIPNNLFGKMDNFDYDDSHVIPALIRKIHEAKINNLPFVEIWGSGKPQREFTHVKDVARICIMLMNSHHEQTLMNIGCQEEHTIANIAKYIKEELGYNGKIQFNKNKPDGQPRKPSSNKTLINKTTWTNDNYTPFKEGLKETCDWFIENYPNIRGIKC